MSRPLVVLCPSPDIARLLGRDFRWPVCEDEAHAHALVAQGFSVFSLSHPGRDLDIDLIELTEDLDHGSAHQHIAAAGLDPLKLNVDMGTFGWTQNGAGDVLLIKQAYGRGLWMLPGGEIQLREAPDKAVAREVKEETGYDVRVDRLIAVYGRHQHIGLYFACTAVGGEPRSEWDTEVADIGWFDPANPPEPASPVLPLLRADLDTGQAAARFF